MPNGHTCYTRSFSGFQQVIKNLGGVWAGPYVMFSQHQAYYSAHYNPNYPDPHPGDSVINYRHVDGFWYGYGVHAADCPFAVIQQKED